MTDAILSAEELLSGASVLKTVSIPMQILSPANDTEHDDMTPKKRRVVLKPLTVKDIQMISRATREDDTLVSTLMIQQALVEPKLTVPQIVSLHGGLVEFLVDVINSISGLKSDRQLIADAVQSPLVKACYILSKEFGWTPAEISDMTMGQILLYLETLNADEKN